MLVQWRTGSFSIVSFSFSTKLITGSLLFAISVSCISFLAISSFLHLYTFTCSNSVVHYHCRVSIHCVVTDRGIPRRPRCHLESRTFPRHLTPLNDVSAMIKRLKKTTTTTTTTHLAQLRFTQGTCLPSCFLSPLLTPAYPHLSTAILSSHPASLGLQHGQFWPCHASTDLQASP